jgi:hypothetical protein
MQALLASRCPDKSASLGTQRTNLAALEGIEGLVGVADERQAHLGLLRVRHGTSLGTVDRAGIFLRNLINREVRHINVGAETRLEGSTDATQLIPNNSPEEGVVFDLCGAAVLAAFAANAMIRVTQETKRVS